MVISLDGGFANAQIDGSDSLTRALMVAKTHLFFEGFCRSLVQVDALESLVEVSPATIALEFESSHQQNGVLRQRLGQSNFCQPA